MFEDAEYHRRRAEIEMDQALHAKKPTAAMLHLKLAQMHRHKRDELAAGSRSIGRANGAAVIDRADKEG